MLLISKPVILILVYGCASFGRRCWCEEEGRRRLTSCCVKDHGSDGVSERGRVVPSGRRRWREEEEGRLASCCRRGGVAREGEELLRDESREERQREGERLFMG